MSGATSSEGRDISLLEKLSAENREAQRVADARERLLRHIRYLETSLVAMDAKYNMAVKGDLLSIEVSLTPPPRVEPPPVPEVEAPARKPRLTLSEPKVPDVPPEVEAPAPESVAAPLKKDVPPEVQRGKRELDLEKAVHRHLDVLGYLGPWDAGSDFRLVDMLLQGMDLASAAGQLKVEVERAIRRWRELNQRIGDLDHQKLLLRVLKQRAGLA